MRLVAATSLGAMALGAGLCIVVWQRAGRPKARQATPLAATADPAEPKTGTSASVETWALRAELAQLRGDVFALREARAESAARAPTDRGVATADPEARPRPSVAEIKAAAHERMAEVEAAFRGETIDPGWSSSTSAALRDELSANEGLRYLAPTADCRSRTCRVEILDDGSGVASESLTQLVLQFARTLPNAQADYVDDGHGRKSVVFYMTRN